MSSFLTTVNQRTRNQFRPRASGKGGATSYQLRQYAEATLGGGSLRKVVKLPEGEDENEWLAVNMVDFYNQINLLYGAITEFCSPQTCPEMKATDESSSACTAFTLTFTATTTPSFGNWAWSRISTPASSNMCYLSMSTTWQPARIFGDR
ncbi:protein kinase regulator [Neurospora crassa OR74A]|uniref:protein kinase regulator n=1 Tax=Neurospora crassa (strain ATCC 24698 / 74-OR23-1A / CBS 708.71 / DSM 1257 / FGSC 987) TaxID=367110 RepID=UPI0003CB9129|nr:protein kinase regulator [Neurospora crassa OR74A]EAA27280.3 protein kinase regulator [Neurospora crassa OR74A]|eukprot:XP_956516.3 protein kinase regulator [Neurospora crassa OR74A]